VADPVPVVDYLVLDDEPHLVCNKCEACGARYFDRRNACAACGAANFVRVEVPREGSLSTFTIVSLAAPGVAVPFVAGVIDCAGTSVRGNIVNTPPEAGNIKLGMQLRLTTFPIGTDSAGVQAVGFGFEPLEESSQNAQ
jgi:uncharacterized OB-fold protein